MDFQYPQKNHSGHNADTETANIEIFGGGGATEDFWKKPEDTSGHV